MEHFMIMYLPPLLVAASLAFVFIWSGKAQDKGFK